MSAFEAEIARVRAAIARLPAVFGLKAFPGQRFHISEAASMFCGAGLVYVATEAGEAFCKGSERELRACMVSIDEPSMGPELAKGSGQ